MSSTSRQYAADVAWSDRSRQLAEIAWRELLLQSRERARPTHFLPEPARLLLPGKRAAEAWRWCGRSRAFHGCRGGRLALAAAGGIGDPKIPLVIDDVRNIYADDQHAGGAGFRCSAHAMARMRSACRAAQPEIDLVLMDADDAGARRLWRNARLRSELNFLRLVMPVTACAMKGDQEKCLAAGAKRLSVQAGQPCRAGRHDSQMAGCCDRRQARE